MLARILADERAANQAIINQLQEEWKSTDVPLNRKVDRARADREVYERIID